MRRSGSAAIPRSLIRAAKGKLFLSFILICSGSQAIWVLGMFSLPWFFVAFLLCKYCLSYVIRLLLLTGIFWGISTSWSRFMPRLRPIRSTTLRIIFRMWHRLTFKKSMKWFATIGQKDCRPTMKLIISSISHSRMVSTRFIKKCQRLLFLV